MSWGVEREGVGSGMEEGSEGVGLRGEKEKTREERWVGEGGTMRRGTRRERRRSESSARERPIEERGDRVRESLRNKGVKGQIIRLT